MVATPVKISQLPSASTLTGTELVPVVQSSATVQTTTQAIAALTQAPPLPGDVLTSAGTSAVAAHSMARKLIAAYAGKLFQVRRTSDNSTLDIGTLSDGYADMPTLLSFLGTSSGAVVQIYDQTGNNNILPQSTSANQGALTLRYLQNGRQIPVVTTQGGTSWYRNRSSTSHIPTGANPNTIFMVATNQTNSFIGTYGNMESTVADNGPGHMFAVAHSSIGIGADWEDGVFYGSGAAGTSTQPAQNADFVFAMIKTDGVASFIIKGGPASSPIVNTIYSGGLPTGYTAHFEGGISLGEGGDSAAASVEFVEGVMIAAVTSNATDQAIQNNLSYVYGNTGGFTQHPDVLFTGGPVQIRGYADGSPSTGSLIELVTNDSLTQLGIVTSVNSAFAGGCITIDKSRGGGSPTDYTAILAGDELGKISYRGANGSSWGDGARTRVVAENNPVSGAIPSRYVILTTNGSGSLTEAVRFNSSQTTQLNGPLSRGAPVTKTADFTLANTENWVINNKSGSTCTATLPAASSFVGREVMFNNYQAQTLVSSASNVVPLAGGSAGTAILAGTAGKWATLVSDGTNWIIMAGN